MSRTGGQTIGEFIVDYDTVLAEAEARGFQADDITLSRELLRKARLTAEEKRGVLLTVQNDLTRYNEIRQSVMRLPHDQVAEPMLV